MMLKAIFAKHVWAGDSLLLSGGERVEVERIEPGTYNFILKGGRRIALKEYDIVGLGHRPRPKGVSEADALNRVLVALRNATRIGTLPPGKTFDLTIHQCRVELDPFRDDEALRRVSEAIEAYVLGKAEQPRTLGVSSDPVEAAIDASCGYLGGGGVVR